MSARRTRSLGPTMVVSERTLREADLFWADWTGQPVRWTTRQHRAPSLARGVFARGRGPEDVEDLEDLVAGSSFAAFPEQAAAGPTASPCDVAKVAETLDGFALDSAALTPVHTALIDAMAACIVAVRAGPRPIREVRIVGFTDPTGAGSHNQKLGLRRAEAVRDALVRAVNARAAGAASSITFQPSSQGATQQVPGGAAANRRVTVSVPLSVTGFAVDASDTDTHEIASNLGAAGLEHFVCVKGTGDVVLAAQLSPAIAGNAAGRLTWEGPRGTTVTSPAVGTDARTAKLASTAAGKFPLAVKLDGTVVRRCVVWVVWSTIGVTATRAPSATASGVNTSDGTTGPGLAISAGIDHTFTIQPAEIITDADRPALHGPRTAAVPGAAQTHVISGNTLAGGAGNPAASSTKWDVSRQIRIKILNPQTYPVAQLSRVAGHLWTGQPAATATPEDYPATDTIGNDDTHSGDESNDPYASGGTVTSTDDPTMLMRDATGADGDTFERRYHFREFLRLNLGTRWYRASDFSLWRLHGRFRRVSGSWTNNGSSFARDNAGF